MFEITLFFYGLKPSKWDIPFSKTRGQTLASRGRWALVSYIDILQSSANGNCLISGHLISSTKEMSPITRKSMRELVTQPSFRAVGQTHAKWQAFEKPENKRLEWPLYRTVHLSLASDVYVRALRDFARESCWLCFCEWPSPQWSQESSTRYRNFLGKRREAGLKRSISVIGVNKEFWANSRILRQRMECTVGYILMSLWGDHHSTSKSAAVPGCLTKKGLFMSDHRTQPKKRQIAQQLL